jgi:phosphonoacetaldehyde hydrolase
MIKAVIFDWAGTTVDFGSRAPMEAFVKLFKKNGLDITIADARVPMGLNKWDHIQELLEIPHVKNQWFNTYQRVSTAADIDKLLNEFIPMNKVSLIECSEVIPGVVDVVHHLEFNDIRIGSTTGYVRELMDVLEPLAAKQGYRPEISLCSGDTPSGRPSPQMMKRCADFFGINQPHQMIKVDDTQPGIDEGKNFGCWTVGVAVTGNALGLSLEEFNQLPELEKASLVQIARDRMTAMKPDFVIDSVADLLPIVDKINQNLGQNHFPKAMNQ